MANETINLKITDGIRSYGSFDVQKPKNYTNNDAFIGQHPLTGPETGANDSSIANWTTNNAGQLMSCFEINWGSANEGWENGVPNWNNGCDFPANITTSADLLQYIFMLRYKIYKLEHPATVYNITWNGNSATSFSSTNATTSFTESVSFSSLAKPTASRKYTYTFGSTTRTYTYVHNDATDWGVSTDGAKFSGNLELKNYTFYALWSDGSWDNNSIPSAGSDTPRTITWNLNGGNAGTNPGTSEYTVQYAWSTAISSLPVKPNANASFTSTPSIVEPASSFAFPSDPTASDDSQEFDGWYTTANGGTQITTANIIDKLSRTGDTIFYAHYKAKPVTYYWYVGSTQPTSLPTDDSQLATGLDAGWRKIGTTKPTTGTVIFDGTSQDEINIASTKVTQYFAINSDVNIGAYDSFGADQTSSTFTGPVVSKGMNIYTTVSTSKTFGEIIKVK